MTCIKFNTYMYHILAGLGVEYFGERCSKSVEGKSFLQGYKNVRDSKPTEDTLVRNLAKLTNSS